MTQTTSGTQTTLFLVLVVIAAVLVRKGRSDPAAKDLEKRQRIRPLVLEWLEPVIAAVVVGDLLRHELMKDVVNVVAGAGGGRSASSSVCSGRA